MTKEKIVSDVFYIIKNIVCDKCSAKETKDCKNHLARCNETYWGQAQEITDYFLKQPLNK